MLPGGFVGLATEFAWRSARLTEDPAVNYLAAFRKAAGAQG